MKARVIAKVDPPSGSVVYILGEGASPGEKIGFELDSDRLEARTVDSEIAVSEDMDYFDEKQVTLTRDERVSFAAIATASRCVCDFVIDVTTSDGTVITVDNNGRPWHNAAKLEA